MGATLTRALRATQRSQGWIFHDRVGARSPRSAKSPERLALSTILYGCSFTMASHLERSPPSPSLTTVRATSSARSAAPCRSASDPKAAWKRSGSCTRAATARRLCEPHPRARNHAAEAERPPAVNVPVLQMTVAAPSASRVDQAVHAAPAAPSHLSSFSL